NDFTAAGRIAKRYAPYRDLSSDPSNPSAPSNGVSIYDYLLNASSFVDPLGRTHQVTQPDGTTLTTTYDGFTTTVFDEANHKRVTTIDFLGRVVRKDAYTGDGTTT